MKLGKWTRRALVALPLFAGAAIAAAPFLSAERFKERIHQDLEQALGRRVEINGEATFQLYPRPGVSLSRVVIHELDEVGVEPIAYLDYPESSLDVSVSLTALAAGRLKVSGVRLVAPSMNMAQLADGSWNFQKLLNRGPMELSGIAVERGRLNFKFGGVKSVFYLADTDLTFEADPANPDRFSIAVEGDPARTDRATSSFGRLSGRGLLTRAAEAHIDLSLSLERTPIAEFMTAVQGRSIGLGGFATSQAKFKGPLSAVTVDGRVELQEAERFGWLFSRAANSRLDFQGLIDFSAQELRLETRKELPVSLRVRAQNLLSHPRWAALLSAREAPLDSLRALASEIGVRMPVGTPASGSLSGVLGFSASQGTKGQLQVTNAVVPVPDLADAQVETARVLVDNRWLSLLPAVVRLSERETMTVEARVDPAGGEQEVKLETTGLDLDRSRKIFASLADGQPVPFLDACQQGVWSGTLRAVRDAAGSSEWSGDVRLSQTSFRGADGIAGPLRITSAAVGLRGPAVILKKADITAGSTTFTAEGDFDPRRRRPLRLKLAAVEARAGDIEQILLPSLRRETGGLIARTLRRAPPPPEWLRTRRADGSVQIGTLTVGTLRADKVSAKFVWDGAQLAISGITAGLLGGNLTGQMEMNLAGAEPVYRGSTALHGAAYEEGKVDADAEWQASGIGGAALLASFTGQGNFSARGVTVAPDAVWDTASGALQVGAGRIQLTGLTVSTGADQYQGQASAGADGRLVFDLVGPLPQQKPLRTTARLW